MGKRQQRTIVAASLAAGLLTVPAVAGTARQEPGHLADGRQADTVVLRNALGQEVRILTYGATLQSFTGMGCDGRMTDVVLGYDDVADYERHPNFFGVTVGRYANRIAGAAFTLDGTTYRLPANDGTNSLHGGGKGFDKQLWRIVSVVQGARPSVVLELVSPDGESGYPGTLQTRVTYRLDDTGALAIRFDAETDRPTIVNLTNHAIFNLAGEGSPGGAMDHRLTIPAARYTPVDGKLIPTGELRSVAGSLFDFRTGRVLANGLRDGRDEQIRKGRGYDHNFVLDKGTTAAAGLAATLRDPRSGRTLEVWTTEPGIQLYTGNFLDGTLAGKGGHLYRMGDGIALEPQKFPDSPNQPGFPSARVDPGKPYHHEMIYKLGRTCRTNR